MSFEIILTRTVIPGQGRLSASQQASPLTPNDFALIMDGAPIRKRLDDGTCWLWHPQGMAWLAAAYKHVEEPGDGYISFSVSYAHNQFLKVLADAFELALRMARHLNASVFAGTDFQEITRENAEQILAPHGAFVTEQAALWKQTIAFLDEKIQAPLEYPIGKYDAVNDYFVFFLEPERKFEVQSLLSRLNLSVTPDSVSNDRFAVQDADTGNILACVLQRPNDGALQIRPFYWMESFALVAAETYRLAITLQNDLGGPLFLREKPLTDSLRLQILEHCKGLGVEFFIWLESLRS